MQACLTLDDLTLGYGSHAAVHHLTGTVQRGSLTAIVGANGSGKSTLMKGIVGILAPMSGSCVRGAGETIAYLPQQSELDRSFPADVRYLVSMGLWPRRGLLGRTTKQDRDRVDAAIAAVGMSGFERRPLDTLSGGQLQRALFARVIVQDASLILLDEPFNAVDAATVGDLVALIRTWHGEGRTVMVVAHDLDLVRAVFPQALLLARSVVAWGPTESVLTEENLRGARHFSEAWRDDAPWCEPEKPIRDGGSHDGHDHHHEAHRHGPKAA